MAVECWITTTPIGANDVLDKVGSPQDGAVVVFLGTVRNHHEGKSVEGIGYEAYEAMAADVLNEIVSSASARFGTDRIAVVHRVGQLSVGEVSVAVATSAHHRAEAFGASQEIMEELKRRVPVWKHERFADGTTEWATGTPVEIQGADS